MPISTRTIVAQTILLALAIWSATTAQAAPSIIDEEQNPKLRQLHQDALNVLFKWCPTLKLKSAAVTEIRLSSQFSLNNSLAGKVGWEHYLNIRFVVGDNSAFVPSNLANNPVWSSLKRFDFLAGSGKNPGVMILSGSAGRFYCESARGQPMEAETLVPVPGMAILKGLDAEYGDIDRKCLDSRVHIFGGPDLPPFVPPPGCPKITN